MSRHFFFTVSTLLFLSLFAKLAWEVHKESTHAAMNDQHIYDAYFVPDQPPYIKQVYDITLERLPAGAAAEDGQRNLGPHLPADPADRADRASSTAPLNRARRAADTDSDSAKDDAENGIHIGTLIREIKQDESPRTRILVETYHFGPPPPLDNLAGLWLQSTTSINSVIGLQNIDLDLFVHANQLLSQFNGHLHLKAGTPGPETMPLRFEFDHNASGFMSFAGLLPSNIDLKHLSGGGAPIVVKTEDFDLAGICFSPFTQRAGVALDGPQSSWPVKYLRPDDIYTLLNMHGDPASTNVPYRLGQVVITQRLSVPSPENGQPITAYRAVCKLAQRINDAPDPFRLEALYLADGTVLEVRTEVLGYRLTATLQHVVRSWKKSQDPEIGGDTAAALFDRKALLNRFFPETAAPAPSPEPAPRKPSAPPVPSDPAGPSGQPRQPGQPGQPGQAGQGGQLGPAAASHPAHPAQPVARVGAASAPATPATPAAPPAAADPSVRAPAPAVRARPQGN
ncbi:MAG: hypothetical protein ACREJ2_18985 [Planctomycetota bacterium]